MNLTFFLNTRAEFAKTKRTAIWWITLLAAAFMPAINCLILLNRPDVFVSKLATTPWTVFLHMCWKNTTGLLLPLYVILLNNAVAQIEYRNHGWKQVYALPRRYLDIFFSKFVVVIGYLVLFMVLFNGCILLAGYITGGVNASYTFAFAQIPMDRFAVLSGRIALGILGVTALQYWLSIRFSNFIIPLATGLGLLMTGLVLMDWDKMIYFPYLYPIFLFFADAPDRVDTLVPLIYYAIISFVVFLTAGCLETYYKKEKG